MDRLQQAIAEARAARDALFSSTLGAGPDAKMLAPMAPEGTGLKKPSDLWDEIASFEPTDATLAQNLVVTRHGGPDAAPIDVLRTRVLQQMGQHNWTRLAITSPDPGCGKSTVTMNLAFSMARIDELRVVVVDLDLRRPALGQMLGYSGGHSVGPVLEGRVELSDNIIKVAPNLAFATTSDAVRTPSELLQGGRVTRLLEQIQADYAPDVVLFDLPPLLVSDDALAFLPLADCTLMVAAAEQSSITQIDNCEKEMAARTAMLGVVLNRCAHPGPGYGYGYGSY